MNTAIHYGLGAARGLGAPCGAGTQVAHAAVGTVMSTAGQILMKIPSPYTVIAGAVLEVGSLIQNFFFHPDCSKIATTQIVNQAEQFLQQNLTAWQSLTPDEKTYDTQQAALMNFDNVWAQVVQACEGSGQYGTAGQACVGDRQKGACHFQPQGQCWNWFIGYRDPIANDPQVAINAQSVTVNAAVNAQSAVASVGSAVSSVLPAALPASIAGIDTNLLIGAAVLGLVVFIVAS